MYPFGYNLRLILNKSAVFFRENLREGKERVQFVFNANEFAVG
jgi:hypothetical protein